MQLSKYQSLGNDYFVLEATEGTPPPSPEAIKSLCDRHLGFGSDGLLYGPIDKESSPSLRIFNPDGSEAEKSGNGLRIFARYLFDTHRLKADTPTTFQTLGGPTTVTLLEKGTQVAVEMGQVSFLSSQIPMTGPEREVLREILIVHHEEIEVSAASIGNPHCTIFVLEPPNRAQITKYGPLIENHPSFPQRTNVQIAHMAKWDEIVLEIWERGAGHTLASGSSASAVVAIAARLGYGSRYSTVHMPGGSLKVEVSDDYRVTQTGPVAFIGTCHYNGLP